MNQLTTGSEAWWQARQEQGGPSVVRRDDGDCQVTFWWRDPQGDERTSPVQRVWLHITGVTDHHNLSTPQTLRRLPGTDVWRWETVLPSTWRGSYCLMPVVNTDDFPPSVFSPQGPDRAGLRTGWSRLLSQAIADPLNPHSWRGGRGHAVSALHLPDAPPQPGWDGPDEPFTPPQCITWRSARLGNERRVWIYTIGNDNAADRPLALLFDGQFWAESMPVWPALARLTRQGKLPPAVYVLVDAIDTVHRGHELPCNPAFWQALFDELLPEVHAVAPWQDDPARTLVAGQSFGGLAALYAALRYPDRIGCVISQSGSFWWPDREQGAQGGVLVQQLRSGELTWRAPRVWLEAGVREPLIHAANTALCSLLQQAQPPVIWREVDGGHDALCWRGGLTEGLIALWGNQLAAQGT